jgi:glucokinase
LAATVYAIPFLGPEDFAIIQTGTPIGETRVSVVSAGTGLRQAFQVPEKKGKYTIMDSEGGHCDFAIRNDLESEFLFFLETTYSRGSVERVLSGPGLLNIYIFFITKHAEPEAIY